MTETTRSIVDDAITKFGSAVQTTHNVCFPLQAIPMPIDHEVHFNYIFLFCFWVFIYKGISRINAKSRLTA